MGATSQFKTQEGGTTELKLHVDLRLRPAALAHTSSRMRLLKKLLVMSEWRIFSAVMLHQSVVTRLAHYSPNFSAESYDTWYKEQRVTPVYISLWRDAHQKSIPLRTFREPWTISDHNFSFASDSDTESDAPNGTNKGNQNNQVPEEHTKAAILRLLDGEAFPKVVVAINFQENTWQNHEEVLVSWLWEIPLPTKSVSVEAVFKSLFTIVLISMPIAIWDLMPCHPAYSMVGLANSSNLLLDRLVPRKVETPSSVSAYILNASLYLYSLGNWKTIFGRLSSTKYGTFSLLGLLIPLVAYLLSLLKSVCSWTLSITNDGATGALVTGVIHSTPHTVSNQANLYDGNLTADSIVALIFGILAFVIGFLSVAVAWTVFSLQRRANVQTRAIVGLCHGPDTDPDTDPWQGT